MLPRFFISTFLDQQQINTKITLTDTIYHHWCKVLRAKIGDQAIVFDGQGGEYQVTLTNVDKKTAQVTLDKFNSINRTPPFSATIGLVMSRGERMDYAIQKATEMGVTNIQLLTSERCQAHLKYERDFKKIEHWQAVAVSACEQCGLNLVPKIIAPIALNQWVKSCQADLKLVLALSDGNPDFPSPLPEQIAILIGAEGGLSPAEIQLAQSFNFVPWTIGERVLRTETAPVVALSALHIISQAKHISF